MKKILFVAAIAAMTFTSCNKDSGSDEKSEDCFDCETASATITYCHTDGEDVYTMKVLGQTVDQDIPEGTTWEELKSSLQEACN